jgi:hypothetical protein
VIHRFNRALRLEPQREDVSSEPLVTFVERLDLPPGQYSVTAVLTDPKTAEPHSVKVEVAVPEIPRRALFLVGPTLGRRAESDLVVQSGGSAPRDGGPSGGDTIGDWNSFQPLLIQHVDPPTDLVALTQACFVGKSGKGPPTNVVRSFQRVDGENVGALEPVGVTLEGGDEIRCDSVLDILPLRALRKGGDYLFRASLAPQPEDGEERGEVRFSVGVPVAEARPPRTARAGGRDD